MSVVRVALVELKRLTSGVLPVLVLLAMSCISLLYGSLYLYGNWDAYGNVNGIVGALVVEDEGAVKIRGKQAHAGEHSSRSASPPRAPAHRRRNTSTESSQRTRSRVVCEDSVEVYGT